MRADGLNVADALGAVEASGAARQAGRGRAPAARVRVLYVTDYLFAGGIESQLTDLLVRLDQTRIEPHVLCIYGGRPDRLHFAGRLRAAGIPVTALPLDLTRRDQARAAGQIIAHAWRLRPHIIQPEGYHANLLTRLARPCLPRTRLLGTMRTIATPKQLLYERLSWWTCAALVASGQHLRDDLVRRARVPTARVRVIANSIDVSRFAQPHDANLRARVAPDAGRLLVSVGRISKQKRMHLLAEALGRLRRAGRLPTTAHLLIAGLAQDATEQARLAAAIAREGVAPWITQYGATQYPEDYYHAADATVLFTTLEGISCAMLESLAAGRPVIISGEANRAGVIEDGRTGWVVPTDDIGALAETLAQVFALPDGELEAMRAACVARAREYDIAPLVAAYTDLYADLCATLAPAKVGGRDAGR
jgi:glycosyltransferase involved in cell wall biosynthesis